MKTEHARVIQCLRLPRLLEPETGHDQMLEAEHRRVGFDFDLTICQCSSHIVASGVSRIGPSPI